LEAGPAAAAGATGKSWAWLNANAKKPQHYRGETLRYTCILILQLHTGEDTMKLPVSSPQHM
jgi:hypothetical protein